MRRRLPKLLAWPAVGCLVAAACVERNSATQGLLLTFFLLLLMACTIALACRR